MDADKLHDLISQQNVLIGQSLKNKQQPLQPMVKPEDLKQDYQDAPAVAQDLNAPTKDSVQLAPGRSDQEMKDQQDYMNEQNYNQMRDNGDLPGQDIARGPAAALNPTNGELAANAPTSAKVQAPDVPEKIGAPMIKVQGAATPSDVTSKNANATQQQIDDLSNNATADVNATTGRLGEVADAKQVVADANVEANKEEMGQASAKLEAQQKFVADIHQKVEDASTQLSGELDKMVNIDPNRIWNQGSMGNKFAFLVSAAFGGLQTGGALSNLITNDINAQMQDVRTHGAKANNLVSLMEKYTGNLMDASKMAYDFQNKYFDLSVKAKQLGAAADPRVIMQESMKEILPEYKDRFKNKMDVTKMQQDQDKYYSDILQKNIQNKQEAVKINQDKSKIDISQGSLSAQDAAIAKPVARLFNSYRDMQDIEKNGLDPSSAKYRLFARAAAKGGMTGDAAAALLTGVALSDQQKADFINHYQAERDFYLEKAISDMGNRYTPEKGQAAADGQMAKIYDNALTVRHKQIEQENYLRSTLAPMSNQGLHIMESNRYIGGSPTYRTKKR